MRSLDIVFPDGDIIAVAPVRCIHRQSLDWLLMQIHKTFLESGFGDIKQLYGFAQKLVNLLPRVDVPDEFGFNVELLLQSDFEKLFIQDKKGSEYLPCRIVQLHTFDPPPSKPKKDKQQLPPIPSSGIQEIDLFSSLIGIDESIEGAWLLWNQLDLESVFAAIHQLNEIRKTPEERMNEFVDERYEQWKSQSNVDIYSQLTNSLKKNE